MFDIQEFLADIDVTTGIVLIAVAVAVCAGLYFIAEHFVWRHIREKHGRWMIALFTQFKRPVQVLFFLTLFVIALQGLIVDLEEQLWYQKTYAMGVIAILAWMGIKGVGLASALLIGRFDVSVSDNLKARRVHTQVGVIRRILITLIVFISVACMLMVFEEIRALGVSLIASAGLGAIILGLAAQKTLGNLLTGIQIAITQPIRLDDAVIVEGEWGMIEEINLTYVVVRIWDLRRLILPISYFVDNPFQNWTRHSADLLGAVILFLDYAMPVDVLRTELDRLLEEDAEIRALWDGNVKGIQVIEASEKTMQLRILLGARSSGDAWNLRCLVREHLLGFIQARYPHCLPRIRADWPDKGQAEGRITA